MKKIFYLMLAATIGTAMVACDDDNNDSGDVNGNVEVSKPIKTITIPGDSEGFYTQIDLTRGEDGKVTTITKSPYAQGTLQEDGVTTVSISYEADKVTLTAGDYENVFTLNEAGHIMNASDGATTFEYGNNGMLEKILMDDSEIFTAKYDENNNWVSVIDMEEEEPTNCQASDVPNNASIDLNMLVYLYDLIAPEIDYAILCGLIPSTPNLIDFIGDTDYIKFESDVNEAGEVASVKMYAMGDPYKEFSFDY